MPEFHTAFFAAAGPMTRTLIIALIGYITALDRISVFTPEVRRSIARMSSNVFLPSMLFIRMAKNITPEIISTWWPLPFFVALNISLGLCCGWLLCRLLGRKRIGDHYGELVACCGWGSYAVLPIALAGAACGLEKYSVGRAEGRCEEDAVVMAYFGDWFSVSTLWVFAPYILRWTVQDTGGISNKFKYNNMDENPDKINEDVPTISLSLQSAASSVREAVAPVVRPSRALSGDGRSDSLLEKDAGIAKMVVASFEEEDAMALENPPLRPPSPASLKPGLKEKCWKYAERVAEGAFHIQAPCWAAGLGVLIGNVAFLRAGFVAVSDDHKPALYLLGDALEQIGAAFIPSQLLLLGGNMAMSRDSSSERLHPLATLSVVAIRLLILPIIGIGILVGMKSCHLLPHDPLMEFVMLLQFTLPTAAVLASVSTLFGRGDSVVTGLIIVQYLVAVPILTGAMVIYMTVDFYPHMPTLPSSP